MFDTTTIDGHTLYRDHTDALTVDYTLGCLDLDLVRLNITAPIAPTLLAEFFTPSPWPNETGAIYPLTTGDHLTDCKLFDLRAQVHAQQWKRDAQERAKQQNLPITATQGPAPLTPTTKWEEGAQVVIISLDGIEIERLLMFPATGETLTGLIAANGYTA